MRVWNSVGKPDLLVVGDLGDFYFSEWAASRSLKVRRVDIALSWRSIIDPDVVITGFNLLFGKFLRREAYVRFLVRKIKRLQPKVVVTFIDNDIRFWELKRLLIAEKTKVVAIQNGRRGGLKDIDLDSLDPTIHGVTNYLCFGGAVKELYGRNTSSEQILALGSFRNNLVPVNPRNREGFLWISAFRSQLNLQNVSWEHFFRAESLAVKAFASTARELSKSLSVLGAAIDWEREKCWFDSLLGEGNYTFLRKQSGLQNYEYLDATELVGTVHSTMGYEAIARGGKCLFIDIKSTILSTPIYQFGYPDNSGRDGLWWVRDSSISSVKAAARRLMTIQESDYSSELKKFHERHLSYNPGNTILWDLLAKYCSDDDQCV